MTPKKISEIEIITADKYVARVMANKEFSSSSIATELTKAFLAGEMAGFLRTIKVFNRKGDLK